MGIGAIMFVGYDMILHYMRHHDEAPNRPRFYDHCVVTTLFTTLAGLYVYSHPGQWLVSALMGIMMVSPITWWLRDVYKLGIFTSPNIFYENNCTPEEIERFR